MRHNYQTASLASLSDKGNMLLKYPLLSDCDLSLILHCRATLTRDSGRQITPTEIGREAQAHTPHTHTQICSYIDTHASTQTHPPTQQCNPSFLSDSSCVTGCPPFTPHFAYTLCLSVCVANYSLRSSNIFLRAQKKKDLRIQCKRANISNL